MSGAFDPIAPQAAGTGVDWSVITSKPSTFPSATYTHNQAVANTVWTINHAMNKYPSVTCFDSAGDEIEGSIVHVTANQVTVTFSASTGGTAYLN